MGELALPPHGTQERAVTKLPASPLVRMLVKRILQDAESEVGRVLAQARLEAALGPEWSYALDTSEWVKP